MPAEAAKALDEDTNLITGIMRMRAFARARQEWKIYESAARQNPKHARPPSGYWAEAVQQIEFGLVQQELDRNQERGDK